MKISTKESDLDKFIAWLLQNANPDNKDKKLNACAVDFIKKLLIENNNLKIESVKVNRQVTIDKKKRIDIWVEVNDDYLIIIEDKVFDEENGDQLKDYKKYAEEWCNKNSRKLICIYLKVGTDSKSLMKKIEKKDEFTYISRRTLIDFFENEKYKGIKDDIFSNYIKNLESFEEAGNAFTKKKIKDVLKDKMREKKEIEKLDTWNKQKIWLCWRGFYSYLASKLENTDWGKKTNRSTCCLRWPSLTSSRWKGYEFHLSIEQGPLCFKINPDQKDIKEELYKLLKKKMPKIMPSPPRKEETIAIVERKDWLGNDNEIVNPEKVVNRLKEIRKAMEEVLES